MLARLANANTYVGLPNEENALRTRYVRLYSPLPLVSNIHLSKTGLKKY